MLLHCIREHSRIISLPFLDPPWIEIMLPESKVVVVVEVVVIFIVGIVVVET